MSSLSLSKGEGKPNSPERTADLMQGGHERGRRTYAPADDRT